MSSGQIVGKMHIQKLLNVPLYIRKCSSVSWNPVPTGARAEEEEAGVAAVENCIVFVFFYTQFCCSGEFNLKDGLS